MLSVITFMTVTFLVLSQRERGSVTTTTDQLIAKQTAASALDRVQIELLGRMLEFTNDQVYGLVVSTNFINPDGFDPNTPYNNFTNVNFDFQNNASHTLLNPNQRLAVLTNLLFNPRPPVFITNRVTGGKDFRFYLDLNRNGRYDTNGIGLERGPNGGFLHPDGTENQNPVDGITNFFIGDPEWIGVLERPELPYSSSNKFIARYAYMAIPAAKTLDVNFIHNQAKRLAIGNDGFLRNQGVGTYEINLAAFLTDLNTNIWNPSVNRYNYNTNVIGSSGGVSFEDALTLLRYRYSLNGSSLAGNYNNLSIGLPLADSGFIDEYANGDATGKLMTGEKWANDFNDKANGFPGAENPSHFFTTQEFFDRTKLTSGNPVSFVDRLNLANTTFTNSSYDRYTYYRMLEQLGTDSSPERGKININYRNMTNGVIVPGLETNQLVWSPGEFFTNAANRLLRSHTTTWNNADHLNFTNTFGVSEPFGITNIPVFVNTMYVSNGIPLYRTNLYGYTPSVHRLLQVVANIYDSTTNEFSDTYPYDPHVFRPIFRRDVSNNVFIVDYREVNAVSTRLLRLLTSTNQVDLSQPTGTFGRSSLPLIGAPVQAIDTEPMVSGIPLVIGAKKGFPVFSKFASQNAVNVSRTLQFHKEPNQVQVSWTNQIYAVGISNAFAMQAFNPYSTAFSRPLVMYASADVTLYMTNEFGVIGDPITRLPLTKRFSVDLPPRLIPNWPAFKPQNVAAFITPFVSNYVFVANNVWYRQAALNGGGEMIASGKPPWDPPNTFHVPKLWLGFRARARFVLLDTVRPGRIVDYVNLDSEEAPINIMQTVMDNPNDCSAYPPTINSMWCTNRIGNPTGAPAADNPAIPTYGIQNQIDVSLGVYSEADDDLWRSYNKTQVKDKPGSIQNFNSALFDKSPGRIDFEAPFNPSRTFFQYVRWESNDPLVHYTIPDLTDLLVKPTPIEYQTANGQAPNSPITKMLSVNPLNDRYLPWGGNPTKGGEAETTPPTNLDPKVKDPLMLSADDWDFPTNKLPNVGWLGRVHRGTPWQTIYMKSSDVANNTWFRWTGNLKGNGDDAFLSRPAKDRELFDLFTTALNPNATRGQLPINQTNLAAWSAVLSGVPVLTNSTADNTISSAIVEPAALSPAVAQIVQGINLTRALTNQNGTLIYPNLQFQQLGDILAVPQLTEASPFLVTNALQSKLAGGINDEVMERIPQQIMSLLTLNHSPRFVVYAYGQTLRPAENSIITASGPFFQMCTNYQVTAETATRTVLRIDGSFNPADAKNDDPVHRYPPRVVIEQFNVLPPD